MTERAISYLLLLAATVAVLLVVIIQPRNTFLQKQRMLQGTNPNLAQSCMMGPYTCEEYAAMVALMTACSTNGGMWNNNQCEYPSQTSQTTCIMAGYVWVNGGCYFGTPSGGGSSSSGSPAAVGGISANEKISQRIESQCLAHVEKSGYGETVKKYGWYSNIRTYANNACTYAYLATNGKYSSNNDLYLIANLLTNDLAVRQEDIGILYQALEDVPAQGKDQSLDDYLNPAKDGAAKRLKDIMDIMASFNDLTTDQKINPSYLAEPLPYVMKDAAEKYNARNGTKIVSLEEKLLALLPKPEVKELSPLPEKEAAKAPQEPEKAAEPKPVTPTEPATPSLRQRAEAAFAKIVNKLKQIREQNLETGIERATVSRDPEKELEDALQMRLIIGTFNEAHERLCVELGLDC